MSAKDWQEFLRKQGAQIDNDWVVKFESDTKPESQAGYQLCALTQLGCIEVKGEEAQQFLQNQLSNDISLVNEKSAQLAAYCSAKGRVISMFWIVKSGGAFLMLLPRDRLEATVKRLRMFVLMSKVEINDCSDNWHVIGVSGEQSLAALRNFDIDNIESPLAVAQVANLIAVRTPGDTPRFLLLLEDTQAQQTWQGLAQQAHCVAARNWINEDINAGIPQVYEATSEAFVPQMLNLHSLSAISFTKGCYPGQEVVARMKYLGKLKRRMYRAELSGMIGVAAGDEIMAEGTDSAVGQVVDVAPLTDGKGYNLLAVLLVSASEQNLYLKEHNEYRLQIKDLPYEVELENT